MDEDLLVIKNLQTHFFTKDGVVKAVNKIDMRIEKAQAVGLVGESGCGKSTISKSIVRLLPKPGKIVGGEIIYKGSDILKLSEDEVRKLRGKEISLVCQDPSSSLNPVYTIGDQIGEAIQVHQKINNKNEVKKKVVEILSKVGIPDPEKRYAEHPHVFSGGMKQRVMIAIAIACNPNLIILDEPTTALDVTTQAQVLELTKQLVKDLGASILLITHNLGIVAEMCDYVYVMYAGSVVESASVIDIFEKPVHPYTRLLLKAIPKIGEKRGHLANIPGAVPELINIPPGCIFADRCFEAQDKCRISVPPLREFSPGHEVACFPHFEDLVMEEQ